MLNGPFNRDDWKEEEFYAYVDLIRYIINNFELGGVDVCLMSHSNGFMLPPNFKTIKGRDYPIVEQLYNILQRTEVANSVYLMDRLYNPKITKGIIANFDMLISGRVHAAVAGLSQNIPTVIIDYGHEPKAHKLQGFAKVANVEQYVADPADKDMIINIVETCWKNKTLISENLVKRNVAITELIHKNFDLLIDL
jgi:colanic acid/amylovoran biosynthesis protein